MTLAVSCRTAAARSTHLRRISAAGRGVCGGLLFSLSAAAFSATASAQAAAAPAAAPAQVITVPVPALPQSTTQSNNPNWNMQAGRETNATAKTDDKNKFDDARTGRVANQPDSPTEFQVLVQQTLGGAFPVFGADLFNNAPSTFAPVNDAQVGPDYIIGTGDEIRIFTSGQLDQQGTFTVDRAGAITIPGVGTFTVAGLRFGDLRQFLQGRIGRVYRNFDLTVTLGQLRSIQVYILGEARVPGAYTVSSLSTLLDALFASGGVRPQGSLRKIELRRSGQLVTTIDLYDLLLHGDKTKDVRLESGDIIFVPAVGPQAAIAGSVLNPAIYELRNETTLAQLLDLARGLTTTATGTTARVESIYNHSQRAVQDITLNTSGSMVVHAGDIITVGSISDQYKDAVTLRGNVAMPGRYVWHPGMRVSDLIPNREVLITRDYYRSQNLLGLPAQNYRPGQGRLAVSTTPSTSSGSAAAPAAANATQTASNRADSPTPTTSNAANANGSGTTVGDALTQNNGTFAPTNDIVLSAPDVDLAYAVIERLDPVALTTSLIPFNLGAMLNGDASQNISLEAGDVVTTFSKADIRVPQTQQTRFVRLEGEFLSAGVYSVKPGETLRQLIARAGGLTPEAYLYASEFTRQSTRRVEEQRLREYADSLEAQINTQVGAQIAGAVDPNSTAQTANASADSARQAVARIRRTQPSGRIVLKLTPTATGVDAVPDLALEDGDRFIVPRQPSSVAVAGEVYNAASFLFMPRLQVRHYLRDAGGPQRTADSKRLFVVRADGSVVSRTYNNVEKATVLPGDTIVMPPRLTHTNILRDAVTIAAALGNLGVGLSVLALVR